MADSAAQWRQTKAALGREHGLGDGREAGDRLCQLVWEHGKLVVQLRRFLVLEATRRPNLASQCLGAGLRALVSQWESQHGYRPLLAESFSDPENHAGTVYKATNRELAGVTKGYAQRHNKTDTARVIVEKGGDYLIGTKENTAKRLAGAAQALKGTPF